jgi:hypothetical protein
MALSAFRNWRFRRLARADAMVMRLNILLLMVVSFLPFPTKLVAEAIDLTSAERAAVIFYCFVLLSISVVIGVLWRYVAAHRDLLEPDVTDEDVAATPADHAEHRLLHRRRAPRAPRAHGRRLRLPGNRRGRPVPHGRRQHRASAAA